MISILERDSKVWDRSGSIIYTLVFGVEKYDHAAGRYINAPYARLVRNRLVLNNGKDSIRFKRLNRQDITGDNRARSFGRREQFLKSEVAHGLRYDSDLVWEQFTKIQFTSDLDPTKWVRIIHTKFLTSPRTLKIEEIYRLTAKYNRSLKRDSD